MKLSFKISLFVFVFFSVMVSYADRGIRSKSRNRVILNISNKTNFRNSLQLNLKAGLKYKGLISPEEPTSPSYNMMSYSYYQKGNTTYLLPNKPKLVTPEIKQGYTGMKLVIKSRN